MPIQYVSASEILLLRCSRNLVCINLDRFQIQVQLTFFSDLSGPITVIINAWTINIFATRHFHGFRQKLDIFDFLFFYNRFRKSEKRINVVGSIPHTFDSIGRSWREAVRYLLSSLRSLSSLWPLSSVQPARDHRTPQNEDLWASLSLSKVQTALSNALSKGPFSKLSDFRPMERILSPKLHARQPIWFRIQTVCGIWLWTNWSELCSAPGARKATFEDLKRGDVVPIPPYVPDLVPGSHFQRFISPEITKKQRKTVFEDLRVGDDVPGVFSWSVTQNMFFCEDRQNTRSNTGMTGECTRQVGKTCLDVGKATRRAKLNQCVGDESKIYLKPQNWRWFPAEFIIRYNDPHGSLCLCFQFSHSFNISIHEWQWLIFSTECAFIY